MLEDPQTTAEQNMSQDVELSLEQEAPDLSQETPPDNVFIAPSIDKNNIMGGRSYTHSSPIPEAVATDMTTECVLGVDEAGRGPVLGPMVYALCYLPRTVEKSLLTETHRFDDSKALTPAVRSDLMEKMCTAGTDLHKHCGWAIRALSARDISSGMMQASGMYNLNSQAMDATVSLIQGTLAEGVNVTDIYIDTIGDPRTYQKKLERIFPQVRITVAKKADSLYPCVSAASICAKVTRDAALEVCYEAYQGHEASEGSNWGSGYPSDARCTNWMKRNMDPVFGWGPECRFSWGTAKDMIEAKTGTCKIDWPVDEDDDDSLKMTSFFASASRSKTPQKDRPDIANWFGQPVMDEVF